MSVSGWLHFSGSCWERNHLNMKCFPTCLVNNILQFFQNLSHFIINSQLSNKWFLTFSNTQHFASYMTNPKLSNINEKNLCLIHGLISPREEGKYQYTEK